LRGYWRSPTSIRVSMTLDPFVVAVYRVWVDITGQTSMDIAAAQKGTLSSSTLYRFWALGVEV